MKLLCTATSPYARKVRVLIHELGRTDVEEQRVMPLDDPAELTAVNPLAKVPTLMLDDGSPMNDSRVMCAYLAQGHPLGEMDWTAQTEAAWAEGLLDIALQVVMERRRTDAEISPWWTSRWRDQILRAVGAMGERTASFSGFGQREIAWAVSLGYLDFRLPDFEWRREAPRLDAWYETVRHRPSMVSTAPPAS
ncbi:MAG: glutathione S-transferase N-terminal domain-containing protein [Myxococcota bacterium]